MLPFSLDVFVISQCNFSLAIDTWGCTFLGGRTWTQFGSLINHCKLRAARPSYQWLSRFCTLLQRMDEAPELKPPVEAAKAERPGRRRPVLIVLAVLGVLLLAAGAAVLGISLRHAESDGISGAGWDPLRGVPVGAGGNATDGGSEVQPFTGQVESSCNVSQRR